jgi:hypothetical protein
VGADGRTRYRRAQEHELRRHANPDWKWRTPVQEAAVVLHKQAALHNLSMKAVATAAGISTSQLWKIQHGRGEYVAPVTMQKLRELPHLENAARFAPVGGSRRRFQAMAVMGYGHAMMRRFMHGDANCYGRSKVTMEYALRLMDVVREHALTPGPQRHAAAVARSAGWLPPEAFDRDFFFDDPLWDGETGILADEDAMDTEAVREEYWFLVDHGMDPWSAAARVGRSDSWMERLWQSDRGRKPRRADALAS